ncbi:MAG: autotransporter-associated beta strand repeat-containing protein, partial [Verrucomicrobiota bacterium]
MKTKSNSFLRLSAITVAITLAALPSARAANATWSTTPTNVDWNVAGNWDVLPTTGTSLVFGNSTQTTLNNDLTSDSFNIAGITFNVGSPAYTISGNAFALTGGITNSSSNLQTINDAFSMTAARTFTTVGGITLGGNVTGTGGGITKAGAGTLSLTGISNAWTGNTTVNAGTLNLNGGFGGTIGSSSSIFGVGLNNGVNGATTAVGTVATGAVANIGGGTYTLSQLSVGYTNFNMAGSGWLTMTNGTITATNSTGYFVIGGENQKPGNGQLGIGQVDLSGNSVINFNY